MEEEAFGGCFCHAVRSQRQQADHFIRRAAHRIIEQNVLSPWSFAWPTNRTLRPPGRSKNQREALFVPLVAETSASAFRVRLMDAKRGLGWTKVRQGPAERPEGVHWERAASAGSACRRHAEPPSRPHRRKQPRRRNRSSTASPPHPGCSPSAKAPYPSRCCRVCAAPGWSRCPRRTRARHPARPRR